MLLSSSQTLLLFVVWVTFQLLVLCFLTSRSSGLGEDMLEICKFDNSSQNISTNSNEDSSCHTIYLLTLLPPPAAQCSSTENNNSLPPVLVRNMGPSLLPAAQLAVDHVNQDPFILPGYKVKLINAAGDCNMTTTALVSFIKHVFYGKDKGRLISGIIGPTCSESTITISSIVGRGGLVLPNVHFASSAELQDRDKYPYTFGVVGSTFQIVDALVSLIRYNRWNRVAILYDDSRASDALYANQRLREGIQSENSNSRVFITFHWPISDTLFPLESLMNSKAKIAVIMSSLALAQKLMCIACHEGMIFPDHQWIIAQYSYSEFTEHTNTTFYYRGKLYECFWNKQNDITIALNHVVFVHFRLTEVDESSPLISGYTYANITKQFGETKTAVHKQNKQCPFPAVPNFIQASTTYDAVWALVLAMNMTVSDSSDQFHCDLLPNIQTPFKDKFPDVNFRGASGHITIDKRTGFVQRIIEIDQIHNGIPIPAGYVFRGNISLYIDPRIPFIQLSQPRYASVNPVLAAFFVLVELTLILATAVVHIVTLLNKEYPSIKASSPGLNQFVFLACYIWGVVAIIFTLILKALGLPDFVFIGNSCHALFVWLIPIALTLSFGTLIAKTWRIYRIFVHFREPGPLISNKALIMIVLIQLSIDVTIATVWTVVSPIMLVAIQEDSYIDDNGNTIVPRMCVYTNPAVWVTIMAGYKILQILALLILCVMTRSIRNEKFSTKSLKIASYLCLLLIAIPTPIYGILWYTNADFIVFCVSFCAFGFTLLFLMVLPPTLPLFVQCLRRQYH